MQFHLKLRQIKRLKEREKSHNALELYNDGTSWQNCQESPVSCVETNTARISVQFKQHVSYFGLKMTALYLELV